MIGSATVSRFFQPWQRGLIGEDVTCHPKSALRLKRKTGRRSAPFLTVVNL